MSNGAATLRRAVPRYSEPGPLTSSTRETQMTNLEGEDRAVAEMLTGSGNYAVVHLPGRRFPGVVFQGDSLATLCQQLRSVLDLSDGGPVHDVLESLVRDLDDVLRSYLDVLERRDLGPPHEYRPPAP